MTANTDSKGGWIDYEPGDPVPSGRVYVKFSCGEDSLSFRPAHAWDWEESGDGQIVSYLPHPEDAKAERLAKAAPALVEALEEIDGLTMSQFADAYALASAAKRIARQALEATGVKQ